MTNSCTLISLSIRLFPSFANSCLRRSESCDRNAERRAGNIVQTNLVAELNGRRIAAVLAADTDVERRIDRLAELDGHFHQLADANLVELCERIVLKDLNVIICGEELAGVVTGEAESHLGEVVCAEAEEVGFLGDIVSCESRSRNLDHGTYFILEAYACGSDFCVSGLNDKLLDELELLDFANQRNHDFRLDLPIGMSLLDIDCGADDSLCLHLCNFRICDSQTAAAMTHHRVELVETGDDCLDVLNGLALCLCQRLDIGFLGGNELVERWERTRGEADPGSGW